MSQLSIIFGMPIMLVLATELTNGGDTSHDLDEVRRCLSLMPPSLGNRVAKLLLIYMGNHYQSVDEDFGTIPERFHSIKGHVVVLRKDLKPLEPDYLEAFCDWIEDDLLPKFTDANQLIKHALDNEADDENRSRMIITIKQNM
ncbi:hypothetical protein M436DRAFT_84508 [Aureobasidium namibiae CBS 147.97]|uniref:Uncharacterized protein n=1 Tax=Aureobasidium namibiae CBS 147.97 TaxID=1043004 RepID=A0A074WKP7_9PEZI|nr:uncharacterized protein M436DRAFT_84508 [Aureobasidium namibiae CBS 147.97]KEQ70412.1 hypothetical protein M436DRAFT_84508 [Aureobasidium namibiae CBS 147.97]